MTDVVVCAHNEAATIGRVLVAVVSAPSAGRVIVVADSCTDDTVAIALQHGAEVLDTTARNKGSAMAQGLDLVDTPLVAFVDADLSGLTIGHVEGLLTAPPLNGQVVGVRDNVGTLTRHLPSISGERRLPTSVARAAGLARAGWAAETRLNVAVERAGLPWAHYVMAGVTNPTRPSLVKYGSVLAQFLLWSPELARYLTHPDGSLRGARAVV